MPTHTAPLFPFVRPAFVGLVFLALAPAAVWPAPGGESSATAYRCGNTYQSQPCAQGQALDVGDGRSPAQQAQAQAAAQRERDQVSAQTRERLAREQREAAQGPGITGLSASRADLAGSAGLDCGRKDLRKKKNKKSKRHHASAGGPACPDDTTLYRAPGDPALAGKKSRAKTSQN